MIADDPSAQAKALLLEAGRQLQKLIVATQTAEVDLDDFDADAPTFEDAYRAAEAEHEEAIDKLADKLANTGELPPDLTPTEKHFLTRRCDFAGGLVIVLGQLSHAGPLVVRASGASLEDLMRWLLVDAWYMATHAATWYAVYSPPPDLRSCQPIHVPDPESSA